MSINVNVINQKLFITSTFDNAVEGSHEFVKFKFKLDESWNKLIVFAQFNQNGNAYNQYLDSENCVYLPAEIHSGLCTVMLYGTGTSHHNKTEILTVSNGKAITSLRVSKEGSGYALNSLCLIDENGTKGEELGYSYNPNNREISFNESIPDGAKVIASYLGDAKIIATTEYVNLKINSNNIIVDAYVTEIPKTLYEQIIQAILESEVMANIIASKQDKNDDNLITSSKNIVEAINEAINEVNKSTTEASQNIINLKNLAHTHNNKTILDGITIDDIHNWNNKVDKEEGKGLSANDYTDDEKSKVNEAYNLSKGANQAKAFDSYLSLINHLNNITDINTYNIGQSFYIQRLDVPDLWIYSKIRKDPKPYNFISDEQFIADINSAGGALQVGVYKVSFLETQKVDLTDYVEKETGKGLSTNDYTDYDKRSVLELDNSYANVKRTVSSNNNTININDSSYSRIREIKSENNQSLQLFRGSAFAISTNQSATLGNITITSDEQGIITINSNSNIQSYETLFFDINTFQFTSTEDYVELPEGDYVAFNNRTGYYPRPGVANAYTEIKVKNPNKSTLLYNIYDNYRTFHVDAGGKVCVRLVINASNIFENMFFKLKIEQGTIPTEWTPQLSPIIFDSNNYKEVYLARGFNMIKGTEPFSITYAADIDLAIQNNNFPILSESTINDNDLIEFVNPTANKRYIIKKKDLGFVKQEQNKGLSTNDYTDSEADKLYEAWTISKQVNKAISFPSYFVLTNVLDLTEKDVYNVGQSIYIQTLNVPDLWVYSIETTSQSYTYTTDEQFISDLNTNGYVQVGYYKLAPLETQKVDLTDYAKKEELPSNTSQLDNDSGFITLADLPIYDGGVE